MLADAARQRNVRPERSRHGVPTAPTRVAHTSCVRAGGRSRTPTERIGRSTCGPLCCMRSTRPVRSQLESVNSAIFMSILKLIGEVPLRRPEEGCFRMRHGSCWGRCSCALRTHGSSLFTGRVSEGSCIFSREESTSGGDRGTAASLVMPVGRARECSLTRGRADIDSIGNPVGCSRVTSVPRYGRWESVHGSQEEEGDP
jgi:hypothetical protein